MEKEQSLIQAAAEQIRTERESNQYRSKPASDAGNETKKPYSNSPPISRKAEFDLRMQMWALKTIYPIITAALFSESGPNVTRPLFNISSTPAELESTIQDKQREMRGMIAKTVEIVDHVANDYQAMGIDLRSEANRWQLRLIMTDCANLVSQAKLFHGTVDANLIKETLSMSTALLHGKDLPGLSDKAIKEDVLAWRRDNNIDYARTNQPYTLANSEIALNLAAQDGVAKIMQVVNRFDFYQSIKSASASLETITRLSELMHESAHKMYQMGLGVTEDGTFDASRIDAVGENSRVQLMMRCISDAAKLVERSYEHEATRAINEIRQASPGEERESVKKHIFESGVPFAQIEFDVAKSRNILTAASKAAVHFLNDAILKPPKANTEKKQEAANISDARGR